MDEQARQLAPEAWLRWYGIWDLYYALTLVALAVVVCREDGATTDRVVALGALGAMAVWYVAYGRTAIVHRERVGPWRGRVFMVGLLVLLVVGTAFQSTMSFALFAVCPLAFMALDLREAIFVVVPANLLPVVSAFAEDGVRGMAAQALNSTLFMVPFAVLLGTWIHRIVSQSEERWELIGELRRSREEVGRLSREAGVAAERARLAAEIHDTLAQGFTSLVTLVQAAESELDRDTDKARRHLALAARTARENLTEARALVAGLTPTALGTGSLDDAVRRQADRFAEDSGIAVTYTAGGDTRGLPTVLEVVLLRMVQESLTNVRKHAGATEVAIDLRVDPAGAAMVVRDNGTGFDQTAPSTGFGLRGMRNRAAEVGGGLRVHSGTEGTTVELAVPR